MDSEDQTKLIKKIMAEDKMMLRDYKGWNVSYPYHLQDHMGIMLVNRKNKVSLAIDNHLLNGVETLCIETECCWSRFYSLDEAIDHVNSCKDVDPNAEYRKKFNDVLKFIDDKIKNLKHEQSTDVEMERMAVLNNLIKTCELIREKIIINLGIE